MITLDSIQKLTTFDPYGNSNIDLSNVANLSEKVCARAFRELIPEIVVAQQNKHMLTIKVASTHVRVSKYIQEKGFAIHHADPKTSFLVKCLHNHTEETCPYPKYKTAYVGIAAVVFTASDEGLKFLAVQEASGPYRGWKAPTGNVDYEKGEDPYTCAAREVFEETGVVVHPENGALVAHGWTPKFRENCPDINFTFGFVVEQEQPVKKQDSEIRQAAWLSAKDFLASKLPVNHDKPLMIKGIVQSALSAFEKGDGWKSEHLHWGSGKAVTLYSNKNRS